MPIGPRTVSCDIKGCQQALTEAELGSGFPGWMQLGGIQMDGVINPMICPRHTHTVMNFVDQIEEHQL